MTRRPYDNTTVAHLEEYAAAHLETMKRWLDTSDSELVEAAIELLYKQWRDLIREEVELQGGFVENDLQYKDMCERAWGAVRELTDDVNTE